MAEKVNKFLEGGYIQPNAIFDVDDYERMGLYVLLYNEVKGSLRDYGLTEGVALDIRINEVIRYTMSAAAKIEHNKDLDPSNRNYLPLTEKEQQFANYAYDWIKRLTPVNTGLKQNSAGGYSYDKKVFLAKDENGNFKLDEYGNKVYDTKAMEAGENYLSTFNKNLERTITEARRVTALGNTAGTIKNSDMMDISDCVLVLDAKKSKVKELHEMVRANSSGKAGKMDKDGTIKSGLHYRMYYEAENQRRKLIRERRKNWFWTAVRGVSAVAFGALTVASVGALLNYGGFALTSLFGTVFNAAGVGGFALGGIGTLVGYAGLRRNFSRMVEGFKKAYELRTKYKEFMGPKYKGKDLQVFLNKNLGKDAAGVTYNEKKTMYFSDLAIKEYLENGQIRPKKKHLKMYLPESVIKDEAFAKESYRFRFVENEKGEFSTILKKMQNVVQTVPGDGKFSHTEALGRAQSLIEKSTLADLENASKFVDDYKEKITPVRAHEFQREISKKLVNAFGTEIFENSYNSQTLRMVEDASKEGSIIDQRLKDSGIENSRAFVDSAIQFLKTEQDSADGSINPALGVNIKHQLSMKPESIVEGCKSISGGALSPAQLAEVRSIASSIASISYNSDTVDVESMTTVSDNVKTYLKFMRDKKLAGSSYSKESIATTLGAHIDESDYDENLVADVVTKEIAGLKRDSKGEIKTASGLTLQQIREKIIEPTVTMVVGGTSVTRTGMNADEQNKAFALLDSQVKALEKNEKDSARETAVGVISDKQNASYAEIKDKISKITLDTISSDETKDLYEKKITKGLLKDYLTIAFKNKIEKLFTNEIDMHPEKYKGTGESIFTNITGMLQKIESCTYIDDAIKQRLVSKLSKNLGVSFETMLQNIEIDFVNRVNSGNLGDQIKKYLTGNYADGGLSHYFAMKTPESEAIKKRILNLQAGASIVDLLSTQVKEGPVIREESHTDTKLATFAFFQSSHSDSVRGYLEVMRDYSSNASQDQFKADELVVDASDRNNFIANMQKLVAECDSSNTASPISGDPLAELSVLLVAKKRCLAGFKYHMQRYLAEKSGNTYVSIDKYLYDNPSERDEFITNVVDAWKREILTSIDARIRAILARPEMNYIKTQMGIINYKGACEIVSENTAGSMDTYMKSNQMER